MRAWLFQDSRQKKKLGAAKCPWSVGWLDPEGRRCSKRIGSKSQAEKFRRKIEGELAAGAYRHVEKKSWSRFRQEYDAKITSTKRPATQLKIGFALNNFERIIRPRRICTIKTQNVDEFIAARREEGVGKGKAASSKERRISPATVNSELRDIKAALRVAVEWGYLAQMPKVRMLKENKRLPNYVTPEDFTKLYTACDIMNRPANVPNVVAADWWRALLMFAYLTGWRISEILALRWEDVDLDAGQAITRAADNKGGRDEIAPLHPVVVTHLRRIQTFDSVAPFVFPWLNHDRTLWTEFGRLQKAGKVSQHYGFHDLRRAFATMNANRLTGDALQSLMRHKSYLTTQRYIAIARQLNAAVADLYVPEVAMRQRNVN